MSSTPDNTPPPYLDEHEFFSWSMLKHPAFKEGMKEMLIFMPGIIAWAFVTGIAMVKAGMPVGLAISMNIFVNAGSAQLAALPLMVSNAPLLIVLIAGLCVNLRFAIFSLQWRMYFLRYSLPKRMLAGFFSGDLMFVLFMKRFPKSTWTQDQMPYFWGVLIINMGGWHIAAIAGVFLGDLIPEQWGLQFAATLAIVALVFSMLRDWITWLVMGVCALSVVLLKPVLPFDLNIVIAILAAIAAALFAERVDAIWRRKEKVKNQEAMASDDIQDQVSQEQT